MKITTLSSRIAKLEGKKVQVNIAQIKEVLACAQKVLKEAGVDFYKVVKESARA